MTELAPAARPRVALLATGGTIACRPGPDGRLAPGVTPEELVASVPELEGVASIRIETLCEVSGFDMEPERMVEVALRAGHLNAPKARLALMVGLHETSTDAELRAWLRDIG